MSVVALIDQRINAAACNGKSEVLASLVELKAALGNQEHKGNEAWKRSFDLNVSLNTACESLRAQLAHEENFSASQIEMRNQAEDERDELKLRLEQLQSALTRPEPSRLEIAAIILSGLAAGSGLSLNTSPKEAIWLADTLIAEARKEVAK